MWHDGSLYVAAPPSIWKLTDTNNDGVADVREEWFKGKTLTGCANDLHGPYLGPDGWIYWCKGAFAKQTYTLANGKEFTTRAAHIFRARPDGSGVEAVMTGGMDNPVGLTFTKEGEPIVSGTFFVHPQGGKRDGLIHAIYGGAYGKDHDVLDGHIRTGDLMPIMTHLGPAAPAGLMRYESWRAFGEGFEDNLFTCNFNLRKITRHVLKPDGSTYKTIDSDFLVSDNSDFHPTDVLEDADGSLIVIDTGGWYKLCCPTSQLYKPDVLGGIYRIRRKALRPIADPRGLKIVWAKSSTEELAKLLDDNRPVVVKRAVQELAARGTNSILVLQQMLTSSIEAQRRNAVWALTRIPGMPAREALNAMFARGKNSGMQGDDSAARAAIQSVSLWRHEDAVSDRLGKMFATYIALSDSAGASPRTARLGAEAIGRSGSPLGADLLLRTANRTAIDRPLEHAIIYALIELNQPDRTRKELSSPNEQVRRIALIALDQMDSLKAEDVTPLLSRDDALLKQTAFWIVSHHSEWGDVLANWFAERLKEPNRGGAERTELQNQLEQFARNQAIQSLLVKTLPGGNASARVIALKTLARSGVRELPDAWVPPLVSSLQAVDRDVLAAAVSLVRAAGPPKNQREELNAALIAVAERGDVPLATRMAAAAAVSGGIRNLSEPLYSRLIGTLLRDATVSERSDAATALARAKLSNARLSELASHVKRVGPMELPKLLPAFTHSTNESVGLKLIDSLRTSKAAQSLRAEVLKPAITNFPSRVQQRAEEWLASVNTDAAQQQKHIEELLGSIKGGDIRRGQAIFNSDKAACSSCHTMGYVGGNVGPDLTRIGQIRNERDLLEAVVYPNASFVRSYEPVMVTTRGGDDFSGVLRKDSADEVVLATGPNAEQRIARSDVTEMRPGSVSVMPSGLADQLTKQELADLVAFLKATRW
jgi:putative heme-binding domain-containing protein